MSCLPFLRIASVVFNLFKLFLIFLCFSSLSGWSFFSIIVCLHCSPFPFSVLPAFHYCFPTLFILLSSVVLSLHYAESQTLLSLSLSLYIYIYIFLSLFQHPQGFIIAFLHISSSSPLSHTLYILLLLIHSSFLVHISNVSLFHILFIFSLYYPLLPFSPFRRIPQSLQYSLLLIMFPLHSYFPLHCLAASLTISFYVFLPRLDVWLAGRCRGSDIETYTSSRSTITPTLQTKDSKRVYTRVS